MPSDFMEHNCHILLEDTSAAVDIAGMFEDSLPNPGDIVKINGAIVPLVVGKNIQPQFTAFEILGHTNAPAAIAAPASKIMNGSYDFRRAALTGEVREATVNAVRHGRATLVSISGEFDGKRLSFAVVEDCSSETLIDALRRTAQGERIVSQEISDTISARRQAPTLSPRQLEILRLVAKGFNNDEIAEKVGISRGGVKAHLAIAFDRLGASSRAEAASLAVSFGLI